MISMSFITSEGVIIYIKIYGSVKQCLNLRLSITIIYGDDIWLERCEYIMDLGISFDSGLSFNKLVEEVRLQPNHIFLEKF